MLHDRRLTSALLAVGVLGFTSLLQATNPSSGSINTPPDDNLGSKQTLTFTAGPFAAGSAAGTQVRDTVAICTQAVTPPGLCDVFAVNFNLPGDYWQTRRGTLAATVTWADAPDGNDLDLYIVDEQGRIVGSSTTTTLRPPAKRPSSPTPGQVHEPIASSW